MEIVKLVREAIDGTTTRILFVTPPGIGHAFPIIPLAWAAKAAGHEVVVATCGMSVGAINRAGLQTLSIGPSDENLLKLYEQFSRDYVCDPAQSAAVASSAPHTFFQIVAESMMDGLIQKALEWRAGIIVHTPQAGAAPEAASRLSLPSVFLGVGLEQTPRSQFEALYSKLGAIVDDNRVSLASSPALWLDVAPPSLRFREGGGVPMRYIPYSGGGAKFASGRPPRKKRIAATMGTVAPHVPEAHLFDQIIECASRTDAEVVIATGTAKPIASRRLPENIRCYPWIPLDSLLASSDAIIHHGGSGTTLTACYMGLPQLIMPVGADQFFNARALKQRGNAVVVNHGETINSETFNLLLEDNSLQVSAMELQEEMLTMSTPAQLVRLITRLATKGV